MTHNFLEELEIPQPPYRMARPVVRLTSLGGDPSGTSNGGNVVESAPVAPQMQGPELPTEAELDKLLEISNPRNDATTAPEKRAAVLALVDGEIAKEARRRAPPVEAPSQDIENPLAALPSPEDIKDPEQLADVVNGAGDAAVERIRAVKTDDVARQEQAVSDVDNIRLGSLIEGIDQRMRVGNLRKDELLQMAQVAEVQGRDPRYIDFLLKTAEQSKKPEEPVMTAEPMTPEEEQAYTGPVTEGKILEPYKAPPASEAVADQPVQVMPAVEAAPVVAAPEVKPEAPAQTQEQPKPQVERTPGQVALDKLNEFQDAAAKFGIESPEAEAARAAYQKAEWAREDAVRRAGGASSEAARAERPWVAEDPKLRSDIERARGDLARARGTERTMLSGALAKQELADLLRNRLAELERIRQEATDKGLPINRYAAEGNMDAVRAELRALETPPGWMGPFRQRVQEKFNETKGKVGGWWESFKGAVSGAKEKVSAALERTRNVRGFIWERIKGIGGFREALQFEKVRSGSKELGKNLEAEAAKLWTEKQLQEQADMIMKAKGYENMDPKDRLKLVEEVRETFLRPARERNEIKINEMVGASMEIFKEKMKKVTHAMTGESAISPERLAIVESTIRQRLQERAASLTGQHMTDYTRELRRLADPHWKSRLGFAGVQAVLAGLGIGYIGAKLIEGTLFGGGKGAAVEGGRQYGYGGGGANGWWEGSGVPGVSPTGLEQIPLPPGISEATKPAFIEMHKNVWTTVAQKAAENGIHLSDSKLVDVVTRVVTDNHLHEIAWPNTGLAGASTRKLMEGFILKFSPSVMKDIGMTVF